MKITSSVLSLSKITISDVNSSDDHYLIFVTLDSTIMINDFNSSTSQTNLLNIADSELNINDLNVFDVNCKSSLITILYSQPVILNQISLSNITTGKDQIIISNSKNITIRDLVIRNIPEKSISLLKNSVISINNLMIEN